MNQFCPHQILLLLVTNHMYHLGSHFSYLQMKMGMPGANKSKVCGPYFQLVVGI